MRGERLIHKAPAEHAHRFVKVAYVHIMAEGLTYRFVCERAGINLATWYHWLRADHPPELIKLEALFTAIGLRLEAKFGLPEPEVIPKPLIKKRKLVPREIEL